jgi:O-antigen/teichoic acid export membrane protein
VVLSLLYLDALIQTGYKIMKPIGHIAAGSIIQQILSIIIFMILTRHLGAEGYGMLAAALALAISIHNFSCNWMEPYIVRTGAKQVFHYNKLGDVYLITTIISFILILLGLVLITVLKSFKIGNIQIYGGISLLTMLLLGLFFLNLLRTGLEATQSFRGYGYSLWSDKIFYLAAVLVLFFYDVLESHTALYANAIGMLLVAILGLVFFMKTHLSLDIKSFFHWQDFFKSTSPVLLTTIIVYFSSYPFVILLVGNLSGLEQAAFISVAFIITGLMLQPITWMTPTFLPKFTVAIESGNQKVLRDQIEKLLFPFVILYSIAVIIFIIFTISTPIIPVLLGEDFRHGISVMVLIICTVVPKLIHLLIIQMLYARHQEMLILMASLAASISFISIAFLFSDSQLFLIGLLIGEWIMLIIEIRALKDIVVWKIQLKLLLLLGLFITLSFLLLMASTDVILTACGFMLLILGTMAFKHRNLFWSYLKSYA